ncbi:FAD-dependent oxidoreductase [uncultured Tateyamaria sp.]|uniref:NAD(P)/FAD-dependent oxidoreductase n=1 Tax=uncultured Tateyamaria sp. TaxID=455651 RepID=UPI00260AD666|nr:FAD-dependent oxidoreductase [uncultured Tateyamaria sp.]
MQTALTDISVTVLGAGMVGVCAALELQSRGAQVTLIDRRAPGQETSFGNAGVIARSSLMPLNNPGLWASLPKLLRNRSAGLRYSLPFLLRNMGWAAGFLGHARMAPFLDTARAMDGLINLSYPIHKQLLAEAGALDRLRETGWMYLYRTSAAFEGGAFGRDMLDQFNVATEVLDQTGLRDLEPGLNPIFERALWIKDAMSVNAPGRVVEAYARLFTDRGGRIVRASIASLTSLDGHWLVNTEKGPFQGDRVVVALGPWSRTFLERAGMRVPMAYERGYHMHYGGPNAGGNLSLTRPIYDLAGGYVLSPMENGLRMTTGVELTDCDALPNHAQLNLVEASARQAIDLGERRDPTPWLGRRPTFADSRPVIGQAPGRAGLYLAFGHQHVGFNTGPGTARVLADIMEGTTPDIPAEPFSPARFIR